MWASNFISRISSLCLSADPSTSVSVITDPLLYCQRTQNDSPLLPSPEELQEVDKDWLLCGFIHLLPSRNRLPFHASQAGVSQKSITAPAFSPSFLPECLSKTILIMAREKKSQNRRSKSRQGVNSPIYASDNL